MARGVADHAQRGRDGPLSSAAKRLCERRAHGYASLLEAFEPDRVPEPLAAVLTAESE